MKDINGPWIGRYKIRQKIGESRQAIVYHAFDPHLDRQVALKTMRAGAFPSLTAEKLACLFEREVKNWACLDNLHIVKIYDIGEHDGLPFLVMQFMPGGTLEQKILPAAQAARLLSPIAGALAYAHQQNVFHGGVKPSNILISTDGEPLLSDFGIARLAEENPSDASETVAEQKTADIHALGLAFFELVSGLRLSSFATALEARHELRMLSPASQEEIEYILLQALAIPPEGGFSSMAEFGQALKNIATPEIINTLPVRRFSKTAVLEGHAKGVNGVAWSPDGKSLASASDDCTIGVWDVQCGELLYKYEGYSKGVWCVSWSPNGRYLAAGCEEKTVSIWDTSGADDDEFEQIGHKGAVHMVSWSPDGSRLASGSDDETVNIWDLNDSNPVKTFQGHSDWVRSVVWSPDGASIASASWDDTIRIWDAESWLLRTKIEVKDAESLWCVVWSPDSRRLALASGDHLIRVWDVGTGALEFILKGHTHSVLSIAWSPDGRRLASASADKTVRVWDITNGSLLQILTEHTDKVWCVAWSADGLRLASASEDKTIILYDET